MHYKSAEVLAQFFSGVYVKENVTNVPDFPPRYHNQINSLTIAEENLLQNLSQLNTTGPDGIHSWILKEGRYGLCKPLSMLYNLSLKCGNSPQIGNKQLLHQYLKRGIGMILITIAQHHKFVKFLNFLYQQVRITNFLTQNKLVTQYQHVFTRGRSCLTNLLTALNDWTLSLDNGESL